MNPTLRWSEPFRDDSVECRDAPSGLSITVHPTGTGMWGWTCAQEPVPPFTIPATLLAGAGFRTREQAQLRCEAVLWREGVLPLPPWVDGMLKIGPIDAQAFRSGTWESVLIRRRFGPVATLRDVDLLADVDGQHDGRLAQHRAEQIIRVLIAEELLRACAACGRPGCPRLEWPEGPLELEVEEYARLVAARQDCDRFAHQKE